MLAKNPISRRSYFGCARITDERARACVHDHMPMLCPVKKSCRRAPLTPTKTPTPPVLTPLPKMKLPPLPTGEHRIRVGVHPTLVWPKWTVYFVLTVFLRATF